MKTKNVKSLVKKAINSKNGFDKIYPYINSSNVLEIEKELFKQLDKPTKN